MGSPPNASKIAIAAKGANARDESSSSSVEGHIRFIIEEWCRLCVSFLYLMSILTTLLYAYVYTRTNTTHLRRESRERMKRRIYNNGITQCVCDVSRARNILNIFFAPRESIYT